MTIGAAPCHARTSRTKHLATLSEHPIQVILEILHSPERFSSGPLAPVAGFLPAPGVKGPALAAGHLRGAACGPAPPLGVRRLEGRQL